MCRRNSIGLVAEDGQIVGFCEVDRRRPRSPVSHRGDLGISVKKEYRGKGIGTILLEKMI
jgi:RimJ/RimL family protein N-acetyltransferase